MHLRPQERFIKEMNLSNSTNEKKLVLSKYPELKELLYWIYHPLKQFNLTSANCKKNINLTAIPCPENILELITNLEARVYTGHDAIGMVNSFVKSEPEYADVIYKILDKDLECRIGVAIINDVFPNLIPEFDVALAASYSDCKDKVDLIKSNYLKLNQKMLCLKI